MTNSLEKVDQFDANNPFSVVNMVSPKLRQAILALTPEQLDMDEPNGKDKFTSRDWSLRASFWQEYERAVMQGRTKIQTSEIIAGIVSATDFYNRFLQNPLKVAFLVKPIQSYEREMTAIQLQAVRELWKLVEMPVIKADGAYDIRAATLKLDIIKTVFDRVNGMAVQRVQSKAVNINVNESVPGSVRHMDNMDTLNDRIAELEKTLQGEVSGSKPALPESRDHPGEVIEVRSVVSEDSKVVLHRGGGNEKLPEPGLQVEKGHG